METAFIKTPLGIAKIAGDDNGIAVISILEEGELTSTIPPVLTEAVQQLQDYFQGKRRPSPEHIPPRAHNFQRLRPTENA